MANISFTPVYPKRKINIERYRHSLIDALKAESSLHRTELKKTCMNWTNPPTMKTDIFGVGNDTVAWTRPTGTEEQVENWERINLGTKKHRITAKNYPTLRFKPGYTARTRKRKFSSGTATRFGGYIFPRSVKHPGIEAREWTDELKKKRERPYKTRMTNAMRYAAIRTFI